MELKQKNADREIVLICQFNTFFQITSEQFHQTVHLIFGTFPVLCGKSIYSHIFNSQLLHIVTDCFQICTALHMSVASGHSLCLRPASITIQNNGNMIWYIHTLVSFSYPVIPLTLLSHHNEPQFPVHYLIQIKREPAFMELSFSFPLYGHDFFALCIHCRINFFDIFICALLDFLLKFFDLILRYILFCKFLKCIICITTNVADCYFGCFAFFLDIFNQFLTAFLCKFREYKADYFTIVAWI